MDGDGKNLGHVDRMSFARKSVRLEGWSTAEKVAFGPPGKAIWHRPDMLRKDVSRALDLKSHENTGFNLVWHGNQSGLILSFKSGLSTLQIVCPHPSRRARLKASLYIRARFVKRFAKASPLLIVAYFWPSPTRKSHAKHALGLQIEQDRFVLDPRIFHASKPILSDEKITIIMPVFNAYDVLWDALDCVLNNTDVPWRLILVEDKSTDVRVRPELRTWVASHCDLGCEIKLIENSKNLGFIQSVNLAFIEALKSSNHVVLLNSDALVPNGWASRLLHPIQKDARIASVTPFSNDAELATAPIVCKRYDMNPKEANAIDEQLRNKVSLDAYVKTPTGVGFCMAINRKYLRKQPEFDIEFGRGYGEEVDWCLKINGLGGHHVVQPNLFVEHRGGVSFGNAQKQRAIANNNQIISERYPKFDRAVHDFIISDQLRSARVLAACLGLSTRQKSVEIFVAHSLGGGAELYLKDRIQSLNARADGCIVLRVGGLSRWRIEVHLPDDVTYVETDDDELMLHMISSIPNCNVIYSCAVGAADAATLPSILKELVQRLKCPFTFLVHDFFAVSPSYCLLDADGRYRSRLMVSNFDRAHSITDAKGAQISGTRWRCQWFDLLQCATEIECFSKSSKDILGQNFPRLSAPILVKPHEIANLKQVRSVSFSKHRSLGILGDIGVQKGAECTAHLSHEISHSRFDRLVIVGRLDPRFNLAENATETGAYKRAEISKHAEQNSIRAWLIPSIWPETFSYTTHEALATGLPVFCFDLGAQAEAVKEAPNGWILPFEWADTPRLILEEIERVLLHDATSRRIDSSAEDAWDRGSAA